MEGLFRVVLHHAALAQQRRPETVPAPMFRAICPAGFAEERGRRRACRVDNFTEQQFLQSMSGR